MDISSVFQTHLYLLLHWYQRKKHAKTPMKVFWLKTTTEGIGLGPFDILSREEYHLLSRHSISETYKTRNKVKGKTTEPNFYQTLSIDEGPIK